MLFRISYTSYLNYFISTKTYVYLFSGKGVQRAVYVYTQSSFTEFVIRITFYKIPSNSIFYYGKRFDT